MIRTGDTIHNPVTGERITFRATSADTDGKAVVIECAVQPDGFVAARHVHPSQSERFAVIDGTLGIKTGPRAGTSVRVTLPVTADDGQPHEDRVRIDDAAAEISERVTRQDTLRVSTT